MSNQYLPKPRHLVSLGLSIPTIVGADVALSQSHNNQKQADRTLPNADRLNKQIEQNYPSELLNEGQTAPNQSSAIAPTASPTVSPSPTGASGTTALTAANYTFILPTPALIAIGVVIGGLALFPIFHLLLSSKKVAEISKSTIDRRLIVRCSNILV